MEQRTQQLYAKRDEQQRALTDRLFSVLAVVLWAATITLYCATVHVEAEAVSKIVETMAALLAVGAVFVGLPVWCTARFPGHRANPYLAAVSLTICSVLLIRVSGRSESECATFVVLAFLAFYRDVRVLALATLIAVGDILMRRVGANDLLRPLVGGGVSAQSEVIAWILIMDLVLYASMNRISAGIMQGSTQEAALEALNEESTQTIALRDRELHESDAVKTIIFESAPDALIRYDADFKIIELNSVAEQMLGLSRQEAAGKDVRAFVSILEESPGSSQTEHQPHVGQFFQGSVVREDRSEFLAECFSAEVPGLAVPQFAMFVRDITERVALESQLASAQKLQSIGQLAAGIAHEINTPTQYIGDNTRFLDDAFSDVTSLLDAYGDFQETAGACAPKDKVESLEQIKEKADIEFLREEIPKAIRESLEGIDRISTIVRAMKDFSHPGADGLTSADVNRILESTATVARNEWKYVADLELDLCPSLPPILCLPGELGQVALNLIVNAAHAIGDKIKDTGEKGLIRISTTHDGQNIIIKVFDSGTGIPEAVRTRVFDPFFTTKEVGKGTGQGLAIAHNVVVGRHGGQLWLESKEGEGTTFTIRLPMDRPDVEESAA